jgi:uncharacterized membrane protein HdeD (DUF308 family)
MTLNSAPGAVPHDLGHAIEGLRGKAGAIIAFGALVALLGVAALVFSLRASLAAITINGVFFALAGAAEIALGMRSRDWGRFAFWIAGGVLYIFVGLVCVFRPMFSLQILTLLFGAGLVAAGLVRAILIAGVPMGQSRLPAFLGAAITVLLGAVILAHWPLDSLWVLGTILGVDLVFHGAGWVAFGTALRSRLR